MARAYAFLAVALAKLDDLENAKQAYAAAKSGLRLTHPERKWNALACCCVFKCASPRL